MIAAADAPLVVAHHDRRVERLLARALGATRRAVLTPGADQLHSAAASSGAAVVIASATACPAEHPIDGCTPTVILCDAPRAVALPLVTDHSIAHLIAGAAPALVDEVMATVQKLLRGDLFGLEKYLGWSAVIEETELTSIGDRRRALGQLSDALTRAGFAARQVTRATLIADELMSNAIHNAPVDDHGHAYLRDFSRDEDRPLTGRERPRMRWGSDGRTLAIEVTDRYGTLDPAVIRRHMRKLLGRQIEIRVGSGGAGLGLAMAYDAARVLVFNLEPGVRTEAIGLVDLGPGLGPGAADPVAAPLVSSFHLFRADPANEEIVSR